MWKDILRCAVRCNWHEVCAALNVTDMYWSEHREFVSCASCRPSASLTYSLLAPNTRISDVKAWKVTYERCSILWEEAAADKQSHTNRISTAYQPHINCISVAYQPHISRNLSITFDLHHLVSRPSHFPSFHELMLPQYSGWFCRSLLSMRAFSCIYAISHLVNVPSKLDS